MTTQRSVVLITVDCLRADHCGFMGYQRPTTPFLDSLARESLVFPTASVAGVPTYYSLPAIIASRYPLAMGRELIGLAAEEKSLASVLKENGYATAFFGAGNPYLSSRFGYDFGFETFRDFLDDPTPSSNVEHSPASNGGWARRLNGMLAGAAHKVPGFGAAYDELYFQYCQRRIAPVKSLDMLRRFPTAEVIVDQARAWLASISENPFFLWLHFMDPHSPYYPTERAAKDFGEKFLTASRSRYLNAYWNRFDIGYERLRRHRDKVVTMYDSGIRWVDAQVSRLVESLRQLKIWERCVVAVTADHGEEFLEHNHRYHAPSLVEELIHVPLLMRVPEVGKRSVSRNPFSLLHLAPTLLDAVDVPIPEEFQGQTYWKHMQQGTEWTEAAISECISGCTNPLSLEQRNGTRLLAVRETRYKLVIDFGTGTEYLYDLEADPQERTPLSSAATKQVRRRLLHTARAHLQRCSRRQLSEDYLRARMRDVPLNSAREPVTASAAR